LGRIILYLKQHDASSYRDLILHACLHNSTYDTQVEGYKTNYMMEIIHLTKEPDYYRQHILDATSKINEDSDDRDSGYLIALTTEFAKQNNAQARQIIYDLVERTFKDGDSRGVGSIIEIDKVDGLVYVLDKLVPILQQKDDPHWSDHLLWYLEDEIGESEAQDALNFVRKTNANVDYYMNQLDEQKQRQAQHRGSRLIPKKPSYAEIKVHIGKTTQYVNTFQWGETAEAQDLIDASNDLIQLNDPKLIWHYLKIFTRAPFPLDPKHLFRFMDVEYPHSYFSIPSVTLSVLSQLQHPSVREFALQLIEKGEWAERAVRMLALNYEANDWKMIEVMSTQTLDIESYHDLGYSVQDVFKQHPDPDAAQTLLNIYNYGPCSTCRRNILLMLKSIDALDEIKAECLYDSNEDIRELAQNDFDDKEMIGKN